MKPDFRHLTLAEIKDHIGRLNRDISMMRAAYQETNAHGAKVMGAGVAGAVVLGGIVPPLGVGILAGMTGFGIEKSAEQRKFARDIEELQTLRAAFKRVYRARPGQKNFDIQARRFREERRKVVNKTKYFWPTG